MKTAFAEECADGSLRELIDTLAVSRFWQEDEVIHGQGELPAGVHIVRSGEIDLAYAAKNGGMRPIRRLVSGDVLGLIEAVATTAHIATAIARSPCETGFLEMARLKTLLDASPEAWFSVLRQLSQDVNRSWGSLRQRGPATGMCHPSHPGMTSVMP